MRYVWVLCALCAVVVVCVCVWCVCLMQIYNVFYTEVRICCRKVEFEVYKTRTWISPSRLNRIMCIYVAVHILWGVAVRYWNVGSLFAEFGCLLTHNINIHINDMFDFGRKDFFFLCSTSRRTLQSLLSNNNNYN